MLGSLDHDLSNLDKQAPPWRTAVCNSFSITVHTNTGSFSLPDLDFMSQLPLLEYEWVQHYQNLFDVHLRYESLTGIPASWFYWYIMFIIHSLQEG